MREQTRLRLPSIGTFFLFEGVTGTVELYEAIGKDGFQSFFVSQSDARDVFFFANRHVSPLFCVLDNGLWDEA